MVSPNLQVTVGMTRLLAQVCATDDATLGIIGHLPGNEDDLPAAHSNNLCVGGQCGAAVWIDLLLFRAHPRSLGRLGAPKPHRPPELRHPPRPAPVRPAARCPCAADPARPRSAHSPCAAC